MDQYKKQELIDSYNRRIDELKEELKLAISALNQIPNTRNSEHGTTYKLIPILNNYLQ